MFGTVRGPGKQAHVGLRARGGSVSLGAQVAGAVLPGGHQWASGVGVSAVAVTRIMRSEEGVVSRQRRLYPSSWKPSAPEPEACAHPGRTQNGGRVWFAPWSLLLMHFPDVD